jgi:hypothetical protein
MDLSNFFSAAEARAYQAVCAGRQEEKAADRYLIVGAAFAGCGSACPVKDGNTKEV